MIFTYICNSNFLHMKRLLTGLFVFFLTGNIIWSQNSDTRVITTAVPFLSISPDARASGLGDQGAATTPDVYAQFWNPSKYLFMDHDIGIGVSYTPYLSKLVNDINLFYLSGFSRLNQRSTLSASIRYFGLGQIQLTDINGNDMGTVSPNEFAIDGTYALKLSENFGSAVSLRFIVSDLKLETSQSDATAAKGFAVDLSGYYQSNDIDMGDATGKYRLAFNLMNLGPKIKYSSIGEGDFIPSTLKLAAGFDYRTDAYNIIRIQLETNKLLVPTPPVRDDQTGEIIKGKDDNVGWIQGIFQSFSDAPGGMSEELKEFQWSAGMEYSYMDAFHVRAGYFHESEIKGQRKYLTVGAGFKYNYVTLDLSYLFSMSQIRTPLDGTMRFSLSFYLDKIGSAGNTKQN